MKIHRYTLNTAGRDFVIGDVHGAYDPVVEALRAVAFDPAVDRLFSVGDLVDRGPGSPRVLSFLSKPWVHPLLGNHEAMFLEIYGRGEPSHAALERMTQRNGMSWWMGQTQESQRAMIAAFRELPVVIEVETHRGTIGLVHGEVPIGMGWSEFITAIEADEEDVIHSALWGRDRVETANASGVEGIGRVYSGHTIVPGPTKLGNAYYIDTASVFGVLANDDEIGRLTMASLDCRTAILTHPQRGPGPVDLRIDAAPHGTPFGVYTTV